MTQDDALKVLKTGANVFLTGEPGAGKTYTLNQYIKWCRENGRGVAITASTGIAATHIDGMTIHSWSGIGIKRKLDDWDIDKILQNDFKKRGILSPKVLVIDEISMLDAVVLDLVDDVCRRARNFMSDAPFGGLQVIFVGDFFQLPPVPDRKAKAVKFAYESGAWKDAAPKVCYLTEQHRQEDGAFLNILTAMRNDEISSDHVKLLQTRNIEPKEEKTILYTHNIEVDGENERELAKLSGRPYEYRMSEQGHEVPVAILKRQCLSPEVLELKVGALVMFTRNNWDVGYVNGTLGIVEEFSNGMPVVRTKSGKTIFVFDKTEWKFVNSNGNTTASIKQLPLRLAWAMTVHKSQGMSLDAAHIDLSKSFEYGQGYVALSRVRSMAGLTLTGFNKKALMMHPDIVKIDKEFRKASEHTLTADVAALGGADNVHELEINPDDIPF